MRGGLKPACRDGRPSGNRASDAGERQGWHQWDDTSVDAGRHHQCRSVCGLARRGSPRIVTALWENASCRDWYTAVGLMCRAKLLGIRTSVPGISAGFPTGIANPSRPRSRRTLTRAISTGGCPTAIFFRYAVTRRTVWPPSWIGLSPGSTGSSGATLCVPPNSLIAAQWSIGWRSPPPIIWSRLPRTRWARRRSFGCVHGCAHSGLTPARASRSFHFGISAL